MSSTPSPAHLRSLYRSVLRELPPRPILATPRTPLHNRLRESFSPSSSSSTSSKSIASSSSSAPNGADTPAVAVEQFIAYLRAQRTYVTLLDRYNPGMNMDEEERVRLTAKRVGMDLPLRYRGDDLK